MRVRGVWEEVVRLRRPLDVGVVERLEVARRRRVDQVDLAAALSLLRVDPFDQLVQVLVPGDGRRVVEVRAHRHDDVVGGVVLGLQRTIFFHISPLMDQITNLIIILRIFLPQTVLIITTKGL